MANVRRILAGGALFAITLAACGLQGNPLAASGGSTQAGSPTGSPDPASPLGRLLAALGKLETGYIFESSVTIGGVTATSAAGRWVGGSSEVAVTASGRTITYRSVGGRAWVQQGDGSWVQADGPVPSGDPLTAFRAPISVQAGAIPSTGADLAVTYAPVALGLTGDAPITVTVHLATDGTVRLSYETAFQGGKAVSTTALHPTPGSAPILAPPGSSAPPSG